MAVAIEPTPMSGDGGGPACLSEGTVLAGRYRVLNRTAFGWSAYDERLSRPVSIAPIDGDGAPDERVRREASSGVALLDAVIFGDEAFAVRTASARV
jgi:hypothetical protein